APAAVVQRHEADAGLAQPASQQQLFAQAAAVAVADARVLPADVEGLAGPAEDQVERLGGEAVQAVHEAGAIDVAVECVEALEQRTAVGQVVEADLEVHVLPGSAAGVERGVGLAEPGGAVAVDAPE